MANPFDALDSGPASAASANPFDSVGPASNPFDSLDSISPTETKKPRSFVSKLSLGARALAKGLTSAAVDTAPQAVAGMIQGKDVPLRDESGIDRFIAEQEADARNKSLTPEEADTSIMGVNAGTLNEGAKMVGYSAANLIPQAVATMGGRSAGAAVGALTGPAAPVMVPVLSTVGAQVAGATAGYQAGKRADMNQVLRQKRDLLLETNPNMTAEEWDGVKSQIDAEVEKHGTAEGKWEAFGNAAQLAIGSLIGKWGKGLPLAKKVLTAAGGVAVDAPLEVASEAMTQIDQANAENAMGMRENPSGGFVEAVKEVGPVTLVTQALTMGIVGGVNIAAQSMKSKAKESGASDTTADIAADIAKTRAESVTPAKAEIPVPSVPLTEAERTEAGSDPEIRANVQRLMDAGIDDQASLEEEVRLMLANKAEAQTISPPAAEESSSSPDALTDLTPVSDGGQGANSLISPPEPAANINTQSAEVTAGDVSTLPSNPIDGEDTGLDMSPSVVNPPVPPTTPLTGKDRIKEKASGDTEILGLPPREQQRKELKANGFSGPAVDQVIEGRKSRAQAIKDKQKARLNPQPTEKASSPVAGNPPAEAHPTTPKVGDIVTLDNGAQYEVTGIREDGSVKRNFIRVKNFTIDYGKTWNEGAKVGDEVPTDEDGDPMPDAFDRTGEVISIDGKKGPGKKLVVQSVSEKGSVLEWIDAPPAPEPMPAVQSPKIEALKKKIRAQREAKNVKYAIGDRVSMADDSRSGTVTGETENGMTMVQWDNAGEGLNPSRAIKRIETTERKAEAPALVPPKSPGAERIKAKLRKPKQPDSNIEEAARRKAEKDAGNSSLLSEAETILKSGRLYPLYKSLLKSAVDKARAGDFSGLASRIEKTKATLATQDAENAVIDKRRDTDVARLIDQYKTVEALTKERDRAQAEMTKASSSKKLGGVSWGKTHDPLSGTRERIEFLNEAINKTASVKVTTEKSGDTTISVPYADKPGLPMKEQKKFLLAEIDKAIEGAKDGDPDEIPHGASVPVFNTVEANNREKFGVVTIDVPGDGEYTLLNSKPVLEKFKKKIGREFPSMLSAQHDTPPRKRGDAYTEKELIDVMSGNPEMIRQYQIQADNGAYNDADTAMVKKAIEKVKGLGIIAPLPPEIAEAKTNALKNVRKNAAEGGLIDTEKKISQDNSNGQAPDTATTGARREENPVSLAKGKDQAPGIRLLSGGFSNDRQERFSAQRESSEKLSESLPAHDLSDYGFPSSGSVMERLRGNKSIEFIAEGNEAIAYRVPEMGIVIKFYPVNSDRTGSAKGYGYVERPGVADGMLTLGEHEWSNSPSDLIEKLKLVDAMGTPTEIVGITKEGVVIVKQADKSIVPNDSIGDGKLESNGVQVFELPGDVAKVPGHALDQSAIIKFDGKWWLASDMHENNRIVDGSGKSHIIDLTLGEIPEAVQNASENSRKFFGLANKRIQDFGEKLGGARKDQVSSVEKEISDDEIANKTLSEIWPKSEVEAIEAPDMAALATALRNEVPAKPRKGYKVARWVERVKLVRTLMKYANEMGFEKLMDGMKLGKYRLSGFVDKVNLLTELPREHWDRIGKVENHPDAYQYVDAEPGEEGAKKNEYGDTVKWYKKAPHPHAVAEVDGRSVTAPSLEALPAAVTEKLGVSPATAAMEFEVRGRDGKGYFINKKGDPLYRKLKEFKTSDEALKYRSSNKADLVAAWEAVKESDNVKETDVRRTDNRPRSGSDWRKGSDATPQMFLDTFGFRGVEFGNWVSQGSNTKERQGMLNQAFDALHDLADIIGVPPKALSLNGTLGLGMGSRGHGWASAHYEPGTIVINLTKTRGAGALAHELFHAFDHYFQRQRPGKEVIDKEGSEMITYQPEAYYEHKTTRDRLSATRFNQLTKDVSYSRIKPEDWTRIEGVRPEVEQAFVDLVTALDKSPMAKRSKLIDKGKSGGYWGRVIERAARAFENYVIFKMQQRGYQNDYLANVVKLEEFNRDPERYPYVRDDELAPIAEAFDGLFSTIKTRETDKGVVMYGQIKGENKDGRENTERKVGDSEANDSRSDESIRDVLLREGRLQRRREFERFLSEDEGGNRRKDSSIWKAVTYSESFENDPRFLRVLDHFAGMGAMAIPVEGLPYFGAVSGDGKLVFIRSEDSDFMLDVAIQHESTHVQARLGNRVISMIAGKVNRNDPRFVELSKQFGRGDDYVSEELIAAAVAGDPESRSYFPYTDEVNTLFDSLSSATSPRESVIKGSRDRGTGVAIAGVESAIAPIRAQFPGITFTVKESGDVAGQQQGRGATLFANRITHADHAKRVALEEAAHAGIRYMTPEQWKGVMNTTFQLRRPEYRRMVDVVKEQYPEYAENSPEFMEEVIAHIAQSGRTNQSLWNRFVAAVRAFFRKQGWLKYLNDNDVDSLINSAFNKVERKAPAFSTTETDGVETRGTAEAMAQDLGVTLTGLPRNSEKTALDRIRLATGWIKTAGGKWMYEASDSRLSVNPDGKTLGEAVSHPTLFKIYPEISSLPAGSTDAAALSQTIRGAIQNSEPSKFSKTSDDYTGEFKKLVKAIEAATPMIEAGVKAGEIKAKRDMTVRGRALVAEDRKKAELQPLKNEPVTIPGIVTAAIKTGQEIEREKGRKMSIEYSVDKSFRAQAKDQGVKEMDWLEQSAERLKYLNDELKRTPDSDRAKVIMTAMSGILGAERSKAALRAAQFRAGDVLEYVSSALHDRMINRYAKGIEKLVAKYSSSGTFKNRFMENLIDEHKESLKKLLSEIPSSENSIGVNVANLRGISYERLQEWWSRWIEIRALERTDRETIIKDERWNSSNLSEKLVEETEKARKSQIDGAIRPKNLGITTDIMVDFFANTSLMAQRAFGGLKTLGHSLFYGNIEKGENAMKSIKLKARKMLGDEMKRLGVKDWKKMSMISDLVDIKAAGRIIKMTRAEVMHLSALIGFIENEKLKGGRPNAQLHILRDGFIRKALSGTNQKISAENMHEVIADILKTLTPQEKAIVLKIIEVNKWLGMEGNKISVKLTGKSLFTEDWYMGMAPERVSEMTADELNTNAGTQKILENSGFTKLAVDHTFPLQIGNIFEAFDSHVDGMSRYIGLTIPLRSIRTAMKANDSALARSLNERMGTDWNRRMTQTMLKMAGQQNPQHGPIKLISGFSNNVMRSVLAWSPGAYFNNRIPGSIMLAAYIAESHPKASARILAGLGRPVQIKTGLTAFLTSAGKENEKDRAYLMEHGFLGDRWDSDYSSIAAPITRDVSSQLKGKFQMAYRHIVNASLNPMMHAEIRNAIAAFKALKAEGVSDVEARDIVAAATRATQNSSSHLDDSAFIQGTRDFGIGGLFPFLSQSVVARNFLVSRIADKNFKGASLAVAGLVTSIGATVMFHALIKSIKNGGDDDDEEKKAAILIDSLGNIFDTIIPGIGIITDQIMSTAMGQYNNGGGIIAEKPLSELAKLAGNILRGKEDIDYAKGVKAATQVLGLPTGGMYSAFGIARGIAAD